MISGDIKLKMAIAEELKKINDFDVITTVLTVSQAANLFAAGQNALIIDIENQKTTDLEIKRLTEKFNLSAYVIGEPDGLSYIRSGITNIMPKPAPGDIAGMKRLGANLARRIENAARLTEAPRAFNVTDYAEAAPETQKIIAIASSTGGTDALPVVLRALPANSPPALIVQHMPSMFTKQFAERLNKICAVKVAEASDGAYLKNGAAFIAPGDLHMRLVKKNRKLAVECFNAERVNGVRPSADVTFNSVLAAIGGNVIGVILTGMGADGAKSLLELHKKGAKIIAQNKETCVVYGMPKSAVELGAVDYILPLDKIGEKIVSLF